MIALRAAAAGSAKHLAENISEIKALCAAESAKPTKTAGTHIGVDACVAVLVVSGFFLFVGKNGIGVLHFFEFFFRRFVIGIAVGMIFHRQLAEGFFNFIIAGAAGHAQRFVKVFVAHRNLLVWNLLRLQPKIWAYTRNSRGGGIFLSAAIHATSK